MILISIEIDDTTLPSEKRDALLSTLDARCRDSVINAIADITAISLEDSEKAITEVHILQIL